MARNGSERKRSSPDGEGGPAFGNESGAPDRARAATVAALRHAIGRIEGQPVATLLEPAERPGEEDRKPKRNAARQPLGAPLFDAALGGGVPRAGLLDLRTRAMRDGGTAIGFVLALGVLFGASPRQPLLWIGAADALAEGGMPYREGLRHFGLEPDALVVVRTRRVADVAWAGEEAARSGAPALTVLEARGNPPLLGLEGTRRLHTRAKEAGRPLVVLRQGGEEEATAAPLRLLVEPVRAAPVAGLEALPLIGRPRFLLCLEKARGLCSRSLALEWDPHDRRFLDHDPRSGCLPAGRVPGAAADPAGERPDPARAPGSVLALRSVRSGAPDADAAASPRRDRNLG